jgi:hypothetical protein
MVLGVPVALSPVTLLPPATPPIVSSGSCIVASGVPATLSSRLVPPVRLSIVCLFFLSPCVQAC